MENLRLKALALHLGIEIEDLNVSSYNEQTIEYGNKEYLVVTDDEADELWEQDLDAYLEECVYPGIPGHLRFYFDDEAWKSDAKFDGRGYSLAKYDGNEYSETVDGTEFYIYRVN